MQVADVVVTCEVSTTSRARQIEAMFDVPPAEKATLRFRVECAFDEQPWQIGLITGASGSGKSTLAKHLFAEQMAQKFTWGGASVLDDFSSELSVEDIANVCMAVGFNTIPAWVRPHGVLSTGEQFRVDLARHLVEGGDLVVVDEFTSVVDRTVAKIGSNAVNKYVRRRPDMKFVAVSCHDDITEWLRPDWIVNMSEQKFEWTREVANSKRPPFQSRWLQYLTDCGPRSLRFTI